ncbi:MAG: DUF4857 domain-containing protein [Bacteroidia bacterium]|nr:DUF4857 domain-containing protein [Bacteroidia bacterium]
MVKFSRYILIVIGILVASLAIPQLYWTMFEKVPVTTTVFYSCTLKDFIILGSEKTGPGGRMDPKGNNYTTAEYEKSMPLMFFRQLMADGNMPDSINGVKMEAASINRANSFFRFTPKKMLAPLPTLYPMLESESGKVNLVMPDDYFRIGSRMEFILAKTNMINEEKSVLFTNALKENGFAFPAKIISGIPTTRKSKDEGYFVTDSEESLFHIKMKKGKPYVARIETPENLGIVYIECVDLRTNEFYCYLFTGSNGIYVVMDEVYDLQRLPVEGFDPFTQTVRINCDLFNKCITVGGNYWLKSTAIDDMYEVVNTYEEKWTDKYERIDGKILSSLVPFQMSLSSPESAFINLNFLKSPGYLWIITNLIFTSLAAFILIKKGRKLKNIIIDLFLTALTGVYGCIAIFIFPNKFN